MKCPGQDSRYWKGDAIFEVKCPKCKGTIEFFKDDTSRKCPSCGHRVPNPEMDFGCAEYCPYAEQCLGTLPDVLGDVKGKQVYRGLMEQLREVLSADPAAMSKAMKAMDLANDVAKRCAESLGPVLAAVSLLVIERAAPGTVSRGELMERYKKGIEPFAGMEEEVKAILSRFEADERSGGAGVLHDIFLLLDLEEQVSAGRIGKDEARASARTGLVNEGAAGVAEKILA